jgi:hypothetical protein
MEMKTIMVKDNSQKWKVVVLVLLWSVVCGLSTNNCFSQGVSINTTGAASDNSAILDISSTSQGLLVPRLTTVQRDDISSPALSLLIFNTTTNCFESFVNGLWYSISCQPICSQMQQTFGRSENDWASSVQQTSDGGYIISGTTIVQGAGDYHAYLIKTDASGNLVWDKIFNEGRQLYSVKQTKDGGYITVGYTISVGAGEYDFYVVRTDGSGNPLWSKTYGGSAKDYAYNVEQLNDGGFIISGATETFGAGKINMYLIRTDGSGNLIWSKTYGGGGYEYGYSLKLTKDGGYIIGGSTTLSFGTGANDFYLVKTDGSGNLIWSKTYGGTKDDTGRSVYQTSDGGYLFAGEATSFGAGQYDAYLIKTDESGNLLWNKTYGGTATEQAFAGQQTSDGGYFMGGVISSYGAGASDVYLIKTDGSGNLSWSKTYGGTASDYIYSAQQTGDGGYVMAGVTMSFGAGASDIYLVKTDENGNSAECNTYDPVTTVATQTPTVRIPATVVTSPATIVMSQTTTVINPQTIVTTPCSLCK